jgi:glycerol uptake facilitator-like aquaporin
LKLILGKLKPAGVLPYWIAQFIGGTVAALAAELLRAGITVTPITPHICPALLAEFLFTFALVDGVERGHNGRHFREFVLRAGHRDGAKHPNRDRRAALRNSAITVCSASS